MKNTPIKTISFDAFLTFMQLTPEAILRNFGGIYLSEVNSDKIEVILVPKGLDQKDIDLPRGSIDISNFGAHRETGVLRLSVAGDLPTTVATQILSAVPYRELSYDREIGHSFYGFFARSHEDHTHFIMVPGTKEAIRFTGVDGRTLSNFEFAVTPNSEVVFSALEDGKFYRSVTPITALVNGYSPTWKGIEIPGNPIGYDLSTRIVDGKVGIVMATEKGAYLYRDGEVISYRETEGKVVLRVATFAGVLDSHDIPTDVELLNNLYFVTKDGEAVRMWTSSITPSREIKNVPITDDQIKLLRRDDVSIISSGNLAYVGIPGNWSVIETNRAAA